MKESLSKAREYQAWALSASGYSEGLVHPKGLLYSPSPKSLPHSQLHGVFIIVPIAILSLFF